MNFEINIIFLQLPEFLDSELWTLDAVLWMLDSGRWTLDAGRYT